jgi:hypothetical protein
VGVLIIADFVNFFVDGKTEYEVAKNIDRLYDLTT